MLRTGLCLVHIRSAVMLLASAMIIMSWDRRYIDDEFEAEEREPTAIGSVGQAVTEEESDGAVSGTEAASAGEPASADAVVETRVEQQAWTDREEAAPSSMGAAAMSGATVSGANSPVEIGSARRPKLTHAVSFGHKRKPHERGNRTKGTLRKREAGAERRRKLREEIDLQIATEEQAALRTSLLRSFTEEATSQEALVKVVPCPTAAQCGRKTRGRRA